MKVLLNMNTLYGEGLSQLKNYNLKHIMYMVLLIMGMEKVALISYQINFRLIISLNIQYLTGFITNISENCKLNGYFIGTCYDE